VTAAKKVARKFKDSDLIGAKLGENLVASLLSAAFPGAIVSRDGVDGEADRMVRLPEGASALRELLNPGGDRAEVSALPTDRSNSDRPLSDRPLSDCPLSDRPLSDRWLHNHHRCR